MLESQLKTDVMLVAGSLASHLHTVRTMANHMNKTKSTLVLIDGVGDVLMEAVSPSAFATYILFSTFVRTIDVVDVGVIKLDTSLSVALVRTVSET